ncbi:MAG: ribosomal protein S18-alanine N-acetyltransferase [Myxococcaceae bacterium]|nr:ribosomal protein S18-alanine N-acetyltransferase [Myxococcaceae bacterium]
MVAADLPEVMRIQLKAFSNPWSEDMVKKELTQDWSTVLLIEEQMAGRSALLGFIIFWLVHDELHILNVAVTPEHRRRGIGRYAMNAALAFGQSHQCRIATLEVRRGNAPAIALYEALGFRTVGLRPQYYADNKEDAAVMVLDFHGQASK